MLNEWRQRFLANQRAWVAAEAVKMIQLQFFGNFAVRFMAAVTPISFILLGNPSAQLHESLASLNPRCLKLADGFRDKISAAVICLLTLNGDWLYLYRVGSKAIKFQRRARRHDTLQRFFCVVFLGKRHFSPYLRSAKWL